VQNRREGEKKAGEGLSKKREREEERWTETKTKK